MLKQPTLLKTKSTEKTDAVTGPPELARRATRLVKMRAAKEAIEADAADRAVKAAGDRAKNGGGDDAVVAKAVATAAAGATPRERTQHSFTDPEARMMKRVDGFHYAYNAQAMVDEHSQVIVVADVTQQAGDVHQPIPMIPAARSSLTNAGIEDDPKMFLADAGYRSQDNLQQLTDAQVNAVVTTGRIRHNARVPDTPTRRIPKNSTQRERMARRMRTKPGRADYARRRAIVEPVFGQMKTRQNAKHLQLRGLTGARGEWTPHAICHNGTKVGNAATTAPIPAT